MASRTPHQLDRDPVSESGNGQVLALPAARLDDATLLAQLIEGRPAAFRELFDRHARLVRNVLVRTLGVDSEIDDLVQETLLVVVRRCSTVRDPRALRSFVYSVALRIARNELRRRAVRRWIAWDDDASIGRSVAPHDPDLAEAVTHIYRALDRLSADLRIAFVLRHVEGYDLAEAAKLSEVSLATFKRRLARAVERFELIAERDPVLAQWLEQRRRR
jgi:RNA polymerase sigma-70 factor (ECF subfamily)